MKPSLLALQWQHGIPALWAAAHMCHEAFNPDGSLSDLARAHSNWTGVKWADWQERYDCKPVIYGTWEVLGGEDVRVRDAFCSCPNGWEQWLRVYSALLTGELYGPMLRYAADPLLYGWAIWQAGWATDPQYLISTARWVAALWDDYADTIPKTAAPTVAIVDAGGNPLAHGWLQDGTTVLRLRSLAESLGLRIRWDADTSTAMLLWPGRD